jgi:hypothetical protein
MTMAVSESSQKEGELGYIVSWGVRIGKLYPQPRDKRQSRRTWQANSAFFHTHTEINH